MRLITVTDHHFYEAIDGSIWSVNAFDEGYWQRYLNIFDKLSIVTRVKEINGKIPANFIRVDSDKISFIKLPDFYGPFQFSAKYFQIKKIMRQNIVQNRAYFFQVPSIITALMVKLLGSHPYGLDVVGDPYDVFSPGATKNIFRPYFRWLFKKNLQLECLHSVSSSYVTKKALQKRYPPGKQTFSMEVSNALITSGQIKKNPRKFSSKRVQTLIYVGTLNQLYKAPDVLIKSLKICHDRGFKYKLKIIGGGGFKNYLIKLSKKLGVAKEVKFLGQINDFKQIFRHLDESDLFVLPSRQEGIPRALLEAMARGLPAVASNVGGIPEILSKDVLVNPNDSKSLAAKIIEVASSVEILTKNSAINLQAVRKFDIKLLQKRQDRVLRVLKRKTVEYLHQTKNISPMISVIMPVFNADKYLVETIESVLEQTYSNFEFIIVNDCSVDNSFNIIQKYQKDDRRIKIISLKKNLGVTGALNAGLKITKGNYIARVDADDPCRKDRFAIQLQYLKQHHDIFMVGSNAKKINEYGKSLSQSLPRFFSWRKTKQILLSRNFIYHSSVMFRMDRKFGYREKIYFCEDYDLYLRLITAGKKIVILPDRLIKYRAVANSITRKNHEKLILFQRIVCKFYQQRLKTGKDSYNNFDPNEILALETKNLVDEGLFSHRIVFNLANNQFLEARKNCLDHFKYFGSFNKNYFFYLLTLLPENVILRLKNIRNFFSY